MFPISREGCTLLCATFLVVLVLEPNVVLAKPRTRTHSMSCYDTERSVVSCSKPVLSNITDVWNDTSKMWIPNRYNKSWDWSNNFTVNRKCGVVPFERQCSFELTCDRPNVTNGSIIFYSFNLSIDAYDAYGVASKPTPIKFWATFETRNLTQANTSYTPMSANDLAYKIFARTLPQPLVSNTQLARLSLNASTLFGAKNCKDERGFVLTSSDRQGARINVTFNYTDQGSEWYAMRKFLLNVSAHFECDQFVYNVTVPLDDDFQGLAVILGIPLALILFICLLGFLKWKFPGMFDCCKKKDGADETGANDEELIRKAQAKRDGKELASPLVDIQMKQGMQTWYDQADAVVEDLNKNCLYIAESKKDNSDMQRFDMLEMEAKDKAYQNAKSDTYADGRSLYAVGNAKVNTISHRPQLQTKGGDEDDIRL